MWIALSTTLFFQTWPERITSEDFYSYCQIMTPEKARHQKRCHRKYSILISKDFAEIKRPPKWCCGGTSSRRDRTLIRLDGLHASVTQGAFPSNLLSPGSLLHLTWQGHMCSYSSSSSRIIITNSLLTVGPGSYGARSLYYACIKHATKRFSHTW